MYVSSEAFVLRKYRFSETSYILHLFTRKFGRVNALAKGARREKSPMQGHFDLYNLEEVTIFRKSRSDLDLATDVTLLNEFRAVRNSLLLYTCVGVTAEIILKACMLYDRHEGAFDALKMLLGRGDEGSQQPVALLVVALLLILRDLGFEPQLDKCTECGRENFAGFVLSPRTGGCLCSDCCGEQDKQYLLGAGELATLRYLVKTGTQSRVGLYRNGIIKALALYCEYHLGTKITAFDVLFAMLAKTGALN